MSLRILTMLSCLLWLSHPASGQETAESTSKVAFGPYDYEVKPDDEAFRLFNPRKAPQPGALLLQTGDRLAICGDSITEQKMYSQIIDNSILSGMTLVPLCRRSESIHPEVERRRTGFVQNHMGQ